MRLIGRIGWNGWMSMDGIGLDGWVGRGWYGGWSGLGGRGWRVGWDERGG